MGNMAVIVLGGVLGGALRGLMGITKSLITKKDEQINWSFTEKSQDKGSI